MVKQNKKVKNEKKANNAANQALVDKYIGSTKPGTYQGTVTASKDALGKVEANLLTAKALQKAAKQIASSVKACSADCNISSVVVFDAKTLPNSQLLRGLRFQIKLIEGRFEASGIRESAEPDARMRAMAGPAVASAGLTALSNILSYFKTDYTVGGVDVALKDEMLVYSVAGALKRAGIKATLPLVFESNTSFDVLDTLEKEFGPLEDLCRSASGKANDISNEIAQLQAAEPPDAAKIAERTADLDDLLEITKSYNEFLAGLMKANPDGVSQISKIMNELMVENACKSNMILLLRTEASGGGYFIKKNLLTALGAMPLWHSGGVCVSYLLLNGDDGELLDGDVVPVHGGFVKAGEVQSELNKV